MPNSPTPEATDLSVHPLQVGEDYENTVLTTSEPLHSSIEGARILHSVLTKIDASTIKLAKLYLTSVKLESCIMVNTDCRESSWHNSTLSRSRLTGLKLTESLLKDCTFENCAINFSLFRFATLKDIKFINCNLQGADFSNASLKQVHFSGCILDEADFSNARLEKVDLRGATITNLKGINYLKGAIISSDQLIGIANDLAFHIGISVQDPK